MGVLLAALLACGGAAAQSVAINRGAGQGLLFEFRGNCYAMMPAHVQEPGVSDVSLDAGTARKGEGRIIQIFLPFDLALAAVRPSFSENCMLALSDLPTDIEPIVARRADLRMVRVSKGEVEAASVELEHLDYGSLTARLGDDASRLLQGNSGAIIFSGAVPIAMAVNAENDTLLDALRMDTIVGYIGRYLEGRDEREDTAAAPEPSGGLAYSLAGCSAEPLRPENSCAAAISGSGPAIFPSGTRGLVIDLDITSPAGAPQAVGEIEIRSAADEATETKPRKIIVTVSPSGKARDIALPFANHDMSADGAFGERKPRPVVGRTLRIVVVDAWRPDLPVRIDSIAIR
jgi:hypothetical protein